MLPNHEELIICFDTIAELNDAVEDYKEKGFKEDPPRGRQRNYGPNGIEDKICAKLIRNNNG